MNPGFRAHRADERGSVLVLVTIGLAAMIGMVGLAMDVGQMYVAKQLAQATADAAAQAGAMDLYNGTGDARATAEAYAMNAGFIGVGTGPGDQINATYQDCATIVWCNNGKVQVSTDSPNLIEVDITKTVNTTLLRVLGPTSGTVTASAFAAITLRTSAIPQIMITHPTLAGAFSVAGASSITISGGIQRSIQVNSTNPSSVSGGGTINLSAAGPSGTGGDLATAGGPVAPPGTLNLGATGHYVQPASTIHDPFPEQPPPLSPPPVPAPAAPRVGLSNGSNGCPASPLTPCHLYSPGLYPAGIDILNETAVFKPGIYYVASGGFRVDLNSACEMATGFTDTITNTGWSGNMLVYNKLGTFSTQSNVGTCTLVGSPASDIQYHGILFFQDPTASATHNFSGSGTLSLTGILYFSNPAAVAPVQFQTVNFRGGNTTIINGGIIANVLSVNGATSITLRSPNPPLVPNVRQVSLVQ